MSNKFSLLYDYLNNKPNKDEYDKGFLACLEMVHEENIMLKHKTKSEGNGNVTVGNEDDERIKADVYNMRRSYAD